MLARRAFRDALVPSPPMTTVLPVSVVIPTLDRHEQLSGLVRSILAGTHVPAEIVIADQSRDERAIDSASGEGVTIRHLRLKRAGASHGRNEGIRVAAHDTVVLIDDDMAVDPAWLTRLVAALEGDDPRTVVTGAVLASAESGPAPSLTTRTEEMVFRGRPFLDPLFSGNMALRRAALDDIGLFDERLGGGAPFPAAEDNDLGYRLLEAGYQVRFVPDAVVWHLGAWRDRPRRALDWAYGRGQGAYYAKHLRFGDRYMWRRFWRNVVERVQRPRREGVYLVAMLLGAADWTIRYRVLGRDQTRQERNQDRRSG
jgi:GT2 family glycosyltransferase